MNKIDLNNRVSVDGEFQSQKKIEKWYVEEFAQEIKDRLNVLRKKFDASSAEFRLIGVLARKIEKVLLYSPDEMYAHNKMKHRYRYVENESTHMYSRNPNNPKDPGDTFSNIIQKAIGYKYYREKGRLVDLAKKINVKVCPYCNMQYTLVADENSKTLARFQFDHFLDKKDYPWFSMSLYNLIPSCAECNVVKSTGTLGLKFHPYKSDIYKQFVFRIPNTEEVLYDKQEKDDINIDMIPQNATSRELYEYNQMFHIKTLYQRHGDIAREVFEKAYQYPYWSNSQNYKSWVPKYSPMNQLRLCLGTYVRQEEIEKRPMTKFIQDLWEQARGKPIDAEIRLEDE